MAKSMEQGGLRLNRREMIIGLAALGVGAAVVGPRMRGGSESLADTTIIEPQSNKPASEPEQMHVESLGIDINELPRENLFADREERNPARVREAFERGQKTGDMQEFMSLLRTNVNEVMTNGKFDAEKAGQTFDYKLEMVLTAFLDDKSLANFVNRTDDGSYARKVTENDPQLVRAFGGFDDDTTDQEIMGYPIYKQITGARQGLANRHIANAQRPGGNLNETIRVIPGEQEITKEYDNAFVMRSYVTLTNDIGQKNPPAEIFTSAEGGYISISADLPGPGENTIIYHIADEPSNTTPLQELAPEPAL